VTPFLPDTLPLPPRWLDAEALLPVVAAASRALARYDGALMTLPNPELLLSPLTANEAVLSSRIEGTQATLDEVFAHEAGADPAPERWGDLEEIMNYRAALRYAGQSAAERGLTLGLLKEVHHLLMRGVRGAERTPGAFRTDQNWIGRPGCALEDARFVPPDPVVMHGALENWQAYVAASPDDPLIAAALAHAQFEIIHPFNDGNGRIGRMIIPLHMARLGVISRPNFYLSAYFERHREQYYDQLLAVSDTRDWTGWVGFFCEAVRRQAEANLARAQALHGLHAAMRPAFADATRSQFATAALDAFFARPIVSAPDFAALAGLGNRATGTNILRQLEEAGLIECVHRGAGRRPSRYAMWSIIRTAEGQESG
jgi:Fic family protein